MKEAWAELVALLAALASGSAGAVDGISLQWGSGSGATGDSGVDMMRVALQWDWSQRWFQENGWRVGGFWDVDVSYWRRDALPGQNEHLAEIGFTPVFRLQQNDLQGAYIEAGVGAHLLSKTSLGDSDYSTAFQFGSHLGVGYRFGARHAFDLGYSFEHISNADIKLPNDGANFN